VHPESHAIEANWKLVYENYYECYHCGPAHKEYAASHSLALDDERRGVHQQQLAKRAAAAGTSTQTVAGNCLDPASGAALQYYYHRYALIDDYLTGSEDGKAVAPLLGHVTAYDGGGSDVQLGNLTYLLVYPDYVVLYRFTPRSIGLTDAELFWFVRGDAEPEQVDFERMNWLWHVTTLADKEIIERNQKGVASRYYQPGPYSPMEEPTKNLIEWYLQAIA
jgi:Rieske 2Fe-2S family protein